MIDPDHLNDLSRLTVGKAARVAFLHAANAAGYSSDLFDPLRLDLFSLLVLSKGQECTDQDVSNALCVVGDRMADDFEEECRREGIDLPGAPDDDHEEPDYGLPIPTERFVREAAEAMAALTRSIHGGDPS